MDIQLDIGYKNQVMYKNVYLQLPSNGIISLIGKNGSGKSTIYKTFLGHIPAIHGKVPKSVTAKCAIVSDYVHIPEENKVRDVLRLSSNFKSGIKKYEKFYQNITKLLDLKVKTLSSGQKRILEIFMVLLSGKEIIILDEATNALDFESKELFLNYVCELSSEILFIHTSHDLTEVVVLNSIPYLLVKEKKKIIAIRQENMTTDTLVATVKNGGDRC
ncbi:hypothetical protein RyT2_24390 [Pseudolactococcus yaeyamensis]